MHLRNVPRQHSLAKDERNLRFRGGLNDISIDKFLYRFENSALSYGTPVHRFIDEIKGFLEEYALEYYWTYREENPCATWYELREALRTQFQDYRDDFDIRSLLENRKQRPRESFEEFFNDIRRLSVRLRTPMSEIETIMMLVRNMNSELQYKLAGQIPRRTNELVRRCISIEDALNKFGPRQDNYRKYVHEVNLDPSYNQPKESYNIDAMNMRLKCWNCRGPHVYQDCEKPITHIFCFGCGNPGLLKKDCPYYKNKVRGNLMAEMRTPGRDHFPKPMNPRSITPPIEAATNTDPELYRKNPQVPR